MKPTYITSNVDLEDDSIRVAIVISTTDGDVEKQGEVLLLAHYIMRIGVLLKKGELKNDFINSLENLTSVESMLKTYVKYYEKTVSKKKMKIQGSAQGNSKKGFTFKIAFDDARHETKFTPRGFGFLGKYIEVSSVVSVLVVAYYLINKYQDDSIMLEKLDSVIVSSTQYLRIHGGKLSPEDEYNMARILVGSNK